MTEPSLPEPVTTADLLQRRRDDEAVGLLYRDDSWTWAEFVRECAVRAAVLTELRTKAGTDTPWHVGVLMDNEPEYLFLIGGAALCGATIVGVNPTRRGAELAGDVARTDCQMVIVGDSYRTLADDLGDVARVPVDGPDYRAALTGARGSTATDWTDRTGRDHNLLLLFTSGSTGAPKAVKCGSARLAAIALLNVHGIDADDVGYNAMPLFHGNALLSVWAPILNVGGVFALRDRFSASGFLPDIQKFRATFFNYVGRSLAYILAQPEQSGERDNVLRFGWGTEASTRDRAEFERRFGVPVTESYGSSEGVCVIVRDETTPPGALGVPNPMLGMTIVNEQNQECPAARFAEDGSLLNGAEAIGEIVARGGAARFEGYYRNEEATAEKTRGGDYWTGDLAYRDADGVYWFAGRTNDWIRVDSENFSTAPLERIVARFDGVIGATAYPVPDPQTGDRVMVTIETERGTFDPDGFAEFLRAQRDMGTKWTPHFVRVTDAFPLTATRKIDKAALRRTGWRTPDRVFEHRDGTYVPFDDDRSAELTELFRRHDRAHLLPSS